MSNVQVVAAPEEVEAESAALAFEDTVPGSLLDRLRETAADTQRKRVHDMEVPGWRGELIMRFTPMSLGQLERYTEKRERNNKAAIAEGIDAMCMCCVGVLARDGERLVELRDADGTIRVEHRLAVLLGWPVPPDAQYTGREVALKLFGGNAFALGEFVDTLVTWMRDPDASESPGKS